MLDCFAVRSVSAYFICYMYPPQAARSQALNSNSPPQLNAFSKQCHVSTGSLQHLAQTEITSKNACNE